MSVSVSLFKLIFTKERIQKPFHMPFRMLHTISYLVKKKNPTIV